MNEEWCVGQKHVKTYLRNGQKQPHWNNLIFSLSNQKRLDLNISYVKIEHSCFYYKEVRDLTFLYSFTSRI